MKRYAVAYANPDGECVIEIVEAEDAVAALSKHSQIDDEFLTGLREYCEENFDLPDEDDEGEFDGRDVVISPTIADAQQFAWDNGYMVAVVEVKR